MRHLLVTNDFPPKVGGIQNYLWELWRRLPPEETFVYTTPYREASAFDEQQGFHIERSREPVLLPNPVLLRRVNRIANRLDVDLVLLDPGLPLGLIGPSLERPYGVVVHGAEVAVPGRLPLTRPLLAKVLRGAQLVVAAGGYPAFEAERAAGIPLPTVVVPPGVDVSSLGPLGPEERVRARAYFGLEPEDLLIVSISRLVPRKDMDVLIRAAASLRKQYAGLRVLIAGQGRDRDRLGRLVAASGAPVEFLGRITESDKHLLLGSADLFAMLCRNRWGGLEQEGFGIVFTEAAACGVPSVCGRSGGAHEAVADGVTGVVLQRPAKTVEVCMALDELLSDPSRRAAYGAAGLQRARAAFGYDELAARLHDALNATVARSDASAASVRETR